MPPYHHRLGVRGPLQPGTPIAASGNDTVVIRDVVTDAVTRNGMKVWDVWDGQLRGGSGSLCQNPGGAFELNSGRLYIRGQYHHSPVALMVGQPFPVVVKNGTVKAGSVGTHWLCWIDTANQTTFIVLLQPTSGAIGKVLVEDTAGSPPPPQEEIDQVDHFLELRGHHLPSNGGQKPLSTNPTLAAVVAEAIDDATWERGLR